jgi:hypothetical protein
MISCALWMAGKKKNYKNYNMAIIGGKPGVKKINRRQFNYLLSAGMGLVRVKGGRMQTVDFVKMLGLKIKFPIKVKQDGKVR